MSEYVYDPSDYLVTTQRAIKAFVTDKLAADPNIGDVVDVEMSFPNTRAWTKDSPLERSLVHFELDDDPAMRLGFGVTTTQEDQDDDTTIITEWAQHELNFDVGIWASPQSGGTTKRSQLRQALNAIFGPAGARRDFTDATDGIVIKSFGGGGDVLDRVNDLPVYRTANMQLVVSVFSRYVQGTPVPIITEVDQRQKLSIVGADGSLEPVRTDENPWT